MGNFVDKKKHSNDISNGIDTEIEEYFISNEILDDETEISKILVNF